MKIEKGKRYYLKDDIFYLYTDIPEIGRDKEYATRDMLYDAISPRGVAQLVERRKIAIVAHAGSPCVALETTDRNSAEFSVEDLYLDTDDEMELDIDWITDSPFKTNLRSVKDLLKHKKDLLKHKYKHRK